MLDIIKPICNKCGQECIAIEEHGVGDDNFYYLSDCCDEEVVVLGEFMSKSQYDRMIRDIY